MRTLRDTFFKCWPQSMNNNNNNKKLKNTTKHSDIQADGKKKQRLHVVFKPLSLSLYWMDLVKYSLNFTQAVTTWEEQPLAN